MTSLSNELVVDCFDFGSGGARKYLRECVPLILEIATQNFSRVTVLVPLSLDHSFEPILKLRNNDLLALRLIKCSKIARLRYCIAASFRGSIFFRPYQVLCPAWPRRVVLMARNVEPFLHWDYAYPIKKRLRNFCLKILTVLSIRLSGGAIFVGQFCKQTFENGGAESGRAAVIPHGYDRFQNAAYRSGENLICVGSLVPYRRVEILLEALKSLHAEGREFHLVLAGSANHDAYVRNVEKWAVTLGLDGFVHVKQNLSPVELESCLQQARLFVTASVVEACPNVVLEARSRGLRVVAPDAGPYQEFLGSSAMYYENGSPDALSKAILEAVDDDSSLPDVPERSWLEVAEETVRFLTQISNMQRKV